MESVKSRVSIKCDVCRETEFAHDIPVEVGNVGMSLANDHFVEITVRRMTAHVCKAKCTARSLEEIVVAMNGIPVC